TLNIGTSSSLAVNADLTNTGTMTDTGSLNIAGSLNITAGAVTVSTGGSRLLVNHGISITGSGKLDLCDNDMVVQATALTRQTTQDAVADKIRCARASGNWAGNRIISSAAVGNAAKITGLAAILNDIGSGRTTFSTLHGQAVDKNSILVKYSWNGATDF